MTEESKQKLITSLREQNISERVLNAIANTDRTLFTESEYQKAAYEDRALPIAEGQTISQPFTVAYMTDLLDPRPEDKILEIGTGSGYQAAVLYRLCKNIYSIERIPALAAKARNRFNLLGIDIVSEVGDGSTGLKRYAPYDKIIVTAAASKVPAELIDMLELGGRLVIPVDSKEAQDMTVIDKDTDGSIEISRKGKFRFVPLIGKKGRPE